VNLHEAPLSLAVVMVGDPKLLFHACSNLASNAIKYSPPSSPIEVVARHESSRLVVQNRDHEIRIRLVTAGSLEGVRSTFMVGVPVRAPAAP